MFRSSVVRAWPYAVALACCGFALYAFDWREVLDIVSNVQWKFLLGVSIPLIFAIFVLRAIRWMAITGLKPRLSTFWDIYFYVAVAIAVATPTPMQMGEALKIKFAQRAGIAVGHSALGIILERIVDLSVIFTMAALGLLWRHGYNWIMLPVALALVAGTLLIPALLQALSRFLVGTRTGNFLGPVQRERMPFNRFLVLLACTMCKWASVALLWQAAVRSVDVDITLPDSMFLVSVVTAVATLSMVPGGIGVAEVSVRAILIGFGIPTIPAEAAAVAIRLLTPLLIGLGLLHLPFLILFRKGDALAADSNMLEGQKAP